MSIFPSPQVQSERIHRVKSIHSWWLEGGGRFRSSDFFIMMWTWWLLWNIKLKCLVDDLPSYCIESKVAHCRHGLHDGTGGMRPHRMQGWLSGSRATWDIFTSQEWRKILTLILQTCKKIQLQRSSQIWWEEAKVPYSAKKLDGLSMEEC